MMIDTQFCIHTVLSLIPTTAINTKTNKIFINCLSIQQPMI